MRTTKEIGTILGISYPNYINNDWGNMHPSFRLQDSIAQQFDGGGVDPVSGLNVTDAVIAFNQVALKAYTLLENIIPVIRRFPKLDWFTESQKLELRTAVFHIVSFQAANNMTWEEIISSTISTPAVTMTNDGTSTLTLGERIGMDAWAFIQASSLWRTHIFDNEEEYIAFVRDTNGNYDIIGKFDLDLYPVLA